MLVPARDAHPAPHPAGSGGGQAATVRRPQDSTHEQLAVSLAAGMPEGLLYALTAPHPGLGRHMTAGCYVAAERAPLGAGPAGDGGHFADRWDVGVLGVWGG